MTDPVSTHTVTPWSYGPSQNGYWNVYAGGNAIIIGMDKKTDAAFIVRACNNFDGLLAAAKDAEEEIRSLREWVDLHVPAELIASEKWGELHKPLVTSTVLRNLHAAISSATEAP